MESSAECATTTTTATDSEGGLPRDHPLFGWVPETFELQRERSAGPMLYYLHTPSGRHMAMAPGGDRGRIIGAIVWWRHGEDSMNMEAEAPFETLKFTLRFVESQIADAHQYSEYKFRDNLLMHLLKNKKGFAIGDTETPSRSLFEGRPSEPGSAKKRSPLEEEGQEVDQQKHREKSPRLDRAEESQDGTEEDGHRDDERTTSSPMEHTDEGRQADAASPPVHQEEAMALEKEQREDDPDGLCMICMENVADTLAVPCMHRVVCTACSLQLRDTADRAVCCRCRTPIEAISYPDNTLVKTE